jgi:formate hydrogenlyase subunit 4
MNGASFLIEALQLAVVVGLSPALAGWVKMLKCWSQGRTSAGILQPYRDLAKLFAKDVVLAENASWVFRSTPYLVFGVAVLIGGIVPILSTALPMSAVADVIVIVGLFAIARFFTALAGMDIGTAFGGMGSSREMTIAALAEPAMLMSIFTLSLSAGSTSLSHIVQVMYSGQTVMKPSIIFALLAFVMITLAETGRIPVDNPSTHLELTMIHEAMILEYSGRHLALMEWAGMMKFFIYASIGICLFFPWGISTANRPPELLVAGFFMVAKLAGIAAGVVLIETGLAKMRLFRLTEFLGAAFLLATLGMLSFYILD